MQSVHMHRVDRLAQTPPRFVSGYTEKMVRDWRSGGTFESVRKMRDDVLRATRKGMTEEQ